MNRVNVYKGVDRSKINQKRISDEPRAEVPEIFCFLGIED